MGGKESSMSVYDSIRDGLQEDWRKARDYSHMQAELESKLAEALSNPDRDAWKNGFHSGFETARRLYRNEKPIYEERLWEDFKRTREIPSNNTEDGK